MKRLKKQMNRLGGASLVLLLVSAAAADGGAAPLWAIVLGCVLGCLGLAACRLAPRALAASHVRQVRHARRMPKELPQNTA